MKARYWPLIAWAWLINLSAGFTLFRLEQKCSDSYFNTCKLTYWNDWKLSFAICLPKKLLPTQLTTRALSYNCSIIFIFQCKLLWSDLRYSTILWIFLYRLMSAAGYLLAEIFLCKQNVAGQNYPLLHILYVGKARMSSGNQKGYCSDTLSQTFLLTTMSVLRMPSIPTTVVSQISTSTKISCKRYQNTCW